MSDQPEGNDNDWGNGGGDSGQDAPGADSPAPPTPPAADGWSIGAEPAAPSGGFGAQPGGFEGQSGPPPTGPPPGFPPQVPPGQQPAGFGQPGFGQPQAPPQQGFGPQGQPGFGQPGFGQSGPPGFGQPGQQGFGPPPQQKSGSGTKVVLIVLGIVGALVLVGVIGVVFLVNRARNVAEDFAGEIENFDFNVDSGGVDEIPEAPRLLQQQASIGAIGSSETFGFTVTEPGPVQIDVLGIDDFDPVLELEDGSGTLIQRDDDGGFGFDSRITTTLQPGSYQAVITEFGDDSGDFQIIVSDL